MSSIRRRKTPHPSYYNKADTIHLQVPECKFKLFHK